MIKKAVKVDSRIMGEDPFLFMAHHLDHYPTGNGNLGIEVPHLEGREIGQDFQSKDGFNMYHGEDVPGFPVHPHRGFETITIARQGLIDHADSLGASGRFGLGDVQWMTAGSGIQHSEMFPLIHTDKSNTLELFQIWFNLPAKNKMVAPEFKMLWNNEIPRDQTDPKVEVEVINGEYGSIKNYASPSNSWAKDPANHVNIFIVKIEPNGVFRYPKAAMSTNRFAYFFDGAGSISVDGKSFEKKTVLYFDSASDLEIKSTDGTAYIMYMEGKPIAESVAQYGPFVMNTQAEIVEAFRDYQQTEFGGWQWDRRGMVHGHDLVRFAKYPDGHIEKPTDN